MLAAAGEGCDRNAVAVRRVREQARLRTGVGAGRVRRGEWPIPVYALGGIDPSNAREAIDAGAHGVAVMGGVMRADHPAAVVQRLLQEVQR